MLHRMEQQYIKDSDAVGTQRNHESHQKQYTEFCTFSKTRLFPVNEFKITKFGTYLSDFMKTVKSIKIYCSTICQDNELKGYKPVHRGIKFHKAITGIHKKLHHKVKWSERMTPELLQKILKVVNLNDDKEFTVWVALVTGFSLILCRSNLVPLSKVHDTVHNLSRSDVRYDSGVMVIYITWSKMNQFGEKVSKVIIVANNNNVICPVRWIKYMTDRISTSPHHNLFCYPGKKGTVVPITYRDLMTTMGSWLDKVGIKNTSKFSSHAMRRGGCFNSNIPEQEIKRMGGWKSNALEDTLMLMSVPK